MLKNLYIKLLCVSAALVFVTTAHVNAVLMPVAGVTQLFSPNDVTVGGPNSSPTDLFYINEGVGLATILPLATDDTPAGGPGTVGGLFAVPFNSDYLFSQAPLVPGGVSFMYTLKFTTKILGWQRVGLTLATGDSAVGLAGITYPISPNQNGARQLEPSDIVIVDGSDLTGRTLLIDWVAYNQMDNIRVFTHVPEPSTYMILGGTIGLAMLLMYRRNRKRA